MPHGSVIPLMPSVNKASENGLNTPEPLRLTTSSLLTARRKQLSISCSTDLSAADIVHYAHLMYGLPDESDAETRVPLPPMDGSFQRETIGAVVVTRLLSAVPHSQTGFPTSVRLAPLFQSGGLISYSSITLFICPVRALGSFR